MSSSQQAKNQRIAEAEHKRRLLAEAERKRKEAEKRRREAEGGGVGSFFRKIFD